jgi:hypothetical protein
MSITFVPLDADQTKAFQNWSKYRALESRLCALQAFHTAKISHTRSVCKTVLSSLRVRKAKCTLKKLHVIQEREANTKAWAAYQEGTAFRAMAKLPAAIAFARFRTMASVKELRRTLT